MALRDAEKTAVNGQVNQMSARLVALRPHVMARVGSCSLPSLHAVLGGKNAKFIDIKTRVMTTPEEFYTEWLLGLEKYIDDRGGIDARYSPLLDLICSDTKVEEYVRTFLMRTFLRHAGSLSKNRPADSEAEVWLGPNNANYGLLVTPRFKNGGWENDKSEIRHFSEPYFTISHVLKTGLVIPSKPKQQRFADIDAYLTFFENTLVRLAASKYQNEIAERYVEHVGRAAEPEKVPLLLPEVRYSRDTKHRYRLDFMVIEPATMMRVGFELSPWSTHGRLAGTGRKTQKQINDEASINRAAELGKLRDYFLDQGVSTVTFTDAELREPDSVFRAIAKYLRAPKTRTQQHAEVMARLRGR